MLASNASTIPIGELASAGTSENFCGMRFFFGAAPDAVSEVAARKATKPSRKSSSGIRIDRRTPIVVNDCPQSFFVLVCTDSLSSRRFNRCCAANFHHRQSDEKAFGCSRGSAYLLGVAEIITAHHARAVMATSFPGRCRKITITIGSALFDTSPLVKGAASGFSGVIKATGKPKTPPLRKPAMAK